MVATPKHPTPDFKYWRFMQPGSQELRDVKAHYAAIVRGLVPGSEPFSAYGRRVIPAAQLIATTIWPGPTTRQPYHPTGITMEIVSTSADDALGGLGMQKVEVHYIKADGTADAQEIELTGLTPIPLQEDTRFIQCTHAIKGTNAVGDIIVRDVATGLIVYSIIPAGDIRCSSASRFIPVDKRFFMLDITGGAVSGTAGSRDELRLASTELDKHKLIDEGIYMPHNGIAVQDASLVTNFESIFPVSGGQIVTIESVSEKGGTHTASYAGWIEDIN